MKLTNDRYRILIGTANFTERYYLDKAGWVKVSARGRRFRMTAEQVLNHLLPALADVKPKLTVKVKHRATTTARGRGGRGRGRRINPAGARPVRSTASS